MSWRHTLLTVAFVEAFGLAPSAARADQVDKCFAAAEEGQRQRDRSEYIAARQSFIQCSASKCPAVAAKDCRGWLEHVNRNMPSLVVSVRDIEGNDVVDAHIAIEGTATEALGGRPVELDPGARTLAVTANGYATTHQKVVVVSGEKNRIVYVKLERNTSSNKIAVSESRIRSSNSEHRSPWALAISLGAAGVVSLGASAFLGFSARGDLDDARNSPCAVSRSCSEDDHRSINRRLAQADVFLGIGLAALVIDAVWLFTQRSAF